MSHPLITALAGLCMSVSQSNAATFTLDSPLALTGGSTYAVDVWFGTNTNALTKIVDQGLNTTSAAVNAPTAGNYFWRRRYRDRCTHLVCAHVFREGAKNPTRGRVGSPRKSTPVKNFARLKVVTIP